MAQGHKTYGSSPGGPYEFSGNGEALERTASKTPAHKWHLDFTVTVDRFCCAFYRAIISSWGPGTIYPASCDSIPSDEKDAHGLPGVMVKLFHVSSRASIRFKVFHLLNERTNKCIHEQIGE